MNVARTHFGAWALVLALVVAVPSLGCIGAAVAQAAPTREQIEQRLGSVGRLIEGSSGGRQIEASGNRDAQAGRAKARESHGAAREAFAAGDLAAASRLLDEAAKAMFAAVRSAAPEQIAGSKDRADFDARLSATRALLDAQRRIAAEKGVASRDAELVHKIEALVGEAQQQVAAGNVGEGRKALDHAYLLAKASIGGMRGGDTLVRSLSFASKEEEFRYEIDRNDTHRMLIDVLLRDRRGGAVSGDRIDEALREAARLRKVAEEQSARGEFEAGVQTLEQSTRELVRAIRGTGLYIPG